MRPSFWLKRFYFISINLSECEFDVQKCLPGIFEISNFDFDDLFFIQSYVVLNSNSITVALAADSIVKQCPQYEFVLRLK